MVYFFKWSFLIGRFLQGVSDLSILLVRTFLIGLLLRTLLVGRLLLGVFCYS